MGGEGGGGRNGTGLTGSFPWRTISKRGRALVSRGRMWLVATSRYPCRWRQGDAATNGRFTWTCEDNRQLGVCGLLTPPRWERLQTDGAPMAPDAFG